jgi:hypothetical protein
MKPGWARINFNYFISEAVFDFLVEAVDLVATDGHRLLADYVFDPRSGQWCHRRGPTRPAVSFDDLLGGRAAAPRHTGEDALPGYLDQARSLLAGRPDRLDDRPSGLPPELEVLREFHLPVECLPGSAHVGRSDRDRHHDVGFGRPAPEHVPGALGDGCLGTGQAGAALG